MLDFNITYQIKQKIILDKISFKLEQGKDLLILGDSGSGKSSLLNILAGIKNPKNSFVKYDDNEIFKLPNIKRDKFRSKNIGIIFQQLYLINILSAYENLSIAAKLNNNLDNNYINYLLEKINLKEQFNKKISDLSVGQQQRVAIAKAFINKPKWILADEPTSALDDKNTKNIIKLMQEEAANNNASLIIATHDKRVKDIFKNENLIRL